MNVIDRESAGEVVHLAVPCETKAIDVEARTVDVVMSTDAIDRYDEIVALDWNLEPYRKNPVVLWAHGSHALPIGRCENVRVEFGALRGTIRFASAAANPMAEQCLQLFRERVLNAVSVGFISHARRFDEIGGKEVLVLEKNELVELSATPVPANPQALAERRARALAARTTNTITTATEAVQETDMSIASSDQKTIDALVAEHAKALESERAKVEKAVADIAAANKRIGELETQAKAVAAERDAAVADAKAVGEKLKVATDTLTERDVDALIGRKLVPAQRDAMLALARSDRKAFDAIVASTPDLKLTEPIVGAGKAAPASGLAVDNGTSVMAEAMRLGGQF